MDSILSLSTLVGALIVILLNINIEGYFIEDKPIEDEVVEKIESSDDENSES
jgi:hypothetical protein